jgi:hypothetical protein
MAPLGAISVPFGVRPAPAGEVNVPNSVKTVPLGARTVPSGARTRPLGKRTAGLVTINVVLGAFCVPGAPAAVWGTFGVAIAPPGVVAVPLGFGAVVPLVTAPLGSGASFCAGVVVFPAAAVPLAVVVLLAPVWVLAPGGARVPVRADTDPSAVVPTVLPTGAIGAAGLAAPVPTLGAGAGVPAAKTWLQASKAPTP